MVWLKKKSAGAAPGYTWERDGDVLDVDEALALELLERPGDEFTEGEPPAESSKTEVTEPEPQGDAEPEGDESQADKKPGRRRTKVSE